MFDLALLGLVYGMDQRSTVVPEKDTSKDNIVMRDEFKQLMRDLPEAIVFRWPMLSGSAMVVALVDS